MRAKGEGTITRRSDGLWAAAITLETGRRKWVYAKTQREAREKLAALRAQRQQGSVAAGPAQTVEQFLRAWLRDVAKTTLRPSSFERYHHQLTAFVLPAFGSRRLTTLTGQQVQALYAERLRQGASTAGVGLLHAVIHRALRDAVRWGLIPSNPCDAVDNPRRQQREVRVLSPDEARRFIAAACEDQFHALWVLAITTGMRRGELLGLKWHDIDLETKTLQVRRTLARGEKGWIESEPKTQKSRRRIELLQIAVDALRAHQERRGELIALAGDRWQERDYVFPTRYGGYLNPWHVTMEHLRPLLARAKCPQIRFHDLRHSTATLLLALNVHPRVVQELLGHSTISMTIDTYSHAVPGMQRQALDRLGDLLGDANARD